MFIGIGKSHFRVKIGLHNTADRLTSHQTESNIDDTNGGGLGLREEIGHRIQATLGTPEQGNPILRPKVILLDDLTLEDIPTADKKIPAIIHFEGMDTHMSVIQISKLPGKTLITARFGIVQNNGGFNNPLPEFYGLCVICIDDAGSVSLQKPILKTHEELESSISEAEKENRMKVYTSQLARLSAQLGRGNEGTLDQSLSDYMVNSSDQGVIYDVTSEGASVDKRVLLVTKVFNNKVIQCEVTISKDSITGEYGIYLGALINEGGESDRMFTQLIYWLIGEGKKQVNDYFLQKNLNQFIVDQTTIVSYVRPIKGDTSGAGNHQKIDTQQKTIGRLQKAFKVQDSN